MTTGGSVAPATRYLRLLRHWAARDFRARYATSALRAVWAVLQPFFFVAIYVLIFGVILKQRGDGVPYLTYLLSGIVMYRIPAAALASSGCLVDSLGVISHVSFPRSVIPVSQMMGNLPDVAVTSVALVVVALTQGVTIGRTALLMPVVLLAANVFATALCIAVSTVQVFVRDLQFVTSFVSMGMFFASPISYSANQVPAWMHWLEWVNPISVFLRALRDVTLRDAWPDGWFWIHFAGACVLLVAAALHLRAIEHRVVDLG